MNHYMFDMNIICTYSNISKNHSLSRFSKLENGILIEGMVLIDIKSQDFHIKTNRIF